MTTRVPRFNTSMPYRDATREVNRRRGRLGSAADEASTASGGCVRVPACEGPSPLPADDYSADTGRNDSRKKANGISEQVSSTRSGRPMPTPLLPRMVGGAVLVPAPAPRDRALTVTDALEDTSVPEGGHPPRCLLREANSAPSSTTSPPPP